MKPTDKKLSSSTAFEVLGGLWLRDRLDLIERRLNKVIMNQTELAQALTDLGAQLQKALDEIIAELQNQNVSEEVIAKLTAAKAVAQQLDDLNPDVP